MKESVSIQDRVTRLQRTLRSTIEQFRRGEDQAGLNLFVQSMEDLEILLEWNRTRERQRVSQWMPAIQMLDEALQNQDLITLTDRLEDTVLPLTNDWPEEEKA